MTRSPILFDLYAPSWVWTGWLALCAPEIEDVDAWRILDRRAIEVKVSRQVPYRRASLFYQDGRGEEMDWPRNPMLTNNGGFKYFDR